MPFTTGTGAETPSVILNAINTLVTSNGWTKLLGDTDVACAAPKAARYWRMIWWENESTDADLRQGLAVAFRTTVGGADLAGTWDSKGIATGTLPGAFITSDINDDAWWLSFDYGSPVTVREFMFQCAGDHNAPLDFAIQWSNDNIGWTTMKEFIGTAWVDNEIKTFDWIDGYLHPNHVSATAPRRAGKKADLNTILLKTYDQRDAADNQFVWQAPGYDADRRVYLHARGHTRVAAATGAIEFTLSPEYDSNLVDWGTQPGGTLNVAAILFSLDPVDYWIYMNGHRLILVVKSGLDDYTSAYVGFLGAFADPDNYPSPLCMTATAKGVTVNFNTGNNLYSSACDPGYEAGYVRLWDNSWQIMGNRLSSVVANLYRENPGTWVWPYHVGGADRGNWPYVWVGDHVDFDNHWLNQQIPTEQGDLPLYPCVLQRLTEGNIGVMDGMFGVPGGTLVPEQVFTISAINYRAFPNRDRRDGCNWFVVRED